MLKPRELRAYLTRHNAFLQANPERLQIFVEKGRIVCSGTRSLSHEYRYTLTLLITDYPASEDELMLPILGWLRVNQPELFENPANWDTAFQFDTELLTHDTADIEIQLALTERVVVAPDAKGRLHATHVAEPAHPDLPEEEETIELTLLNDLGTVHISVPAWHHPHEDWL